MLSDFRSGLALGAPSSHEGIERISPSDDAFLEDLSKRLFTYFWEQADPHTGLVPDRVRADGSQMDSGHRNIATIAATGFGLTAVCIAAERHWISDEEARERVRVTLNFFANQAPREHGWFYHWMDSRTGERRWNSEVSTIDTALLLGGILTAKGKFSADKEIVRLATLIYNRVDFAWMLRGTPALICHGWKPETGFLPYRWNTYSEHTILDMLAIGSLTHPVPAGVWYNWRRDRIEYQGYSYITGGPLFIHQFSHAWIDYRGLREFHAPFTDYFKNSIVATQAHRLFCINLHSDFPDYSANIWGITASDSAHGYMAWGGPPRDPAIDGTVVPAASGGSLMFTPDICLPALKEMRQMFGNRVYGRYGFIDAFNPDTKWVDTDVIGIDQGIMLLSAENLRSGNVWRWFMRNFEIRHAMNLIDLRPYKP